MHGQDFLKVNLNCSIQLVLTLDDFKGQVNHPFFEYIKRVTLKGQEEVLTGSCPTPRHKGHPNLWSYSSWSTRRCDDTLKSDGPVGLEWTRTVDIERTRVVTEPYQSRTLLY